MKRILILDDDPLVLESLTRMFHQARGEWSVETAADGHEAIRRLSDAEFDVVLTDLMMPDHDGLEIIMTLTDRHPRLKILAMSGGGRYGVDCLAAAKHLGACGVLRKPFEFQDLERELRDVLDDEDRTDPEEATV